MRALSAIPVCLLLGACAPHQKPTAMRDSRGFMNAWIVESLNNEAVDNAIVAQRTLHPYHFVNGAPVLNNLGVRDLRVLATHLRRFPGQDLSIRRGDAPPALYQARLKSVTEALEAEGVPADSVRLADRMPGGRGVSGRRQDMILQRAEKPSTDGAGALSADKPVTGGQN